MTTRGAADHGHAPRTTTPPSVAGIVVLVGAALAFLATSPPPPTISDVAIGEVTLSAGDAAERTLDIRLQDTGRPPRSASITAALQAANGLMRSYGWAQVSVLDPATNAPVSALPVASCATGCDLSYRVRVEAGPGLLPGSVIRYTVEVAFVYDGFGRSGGDALSLGLEGAAGPVAAPVWSLLAGLLALLAGITIGPAVDRRLGARHRWPALGLAGLGLVTMAYHVVTSIIVVTRTPLGAADAARSVSVLIDWWSMGIVTGLVAMVVHGVHRWDRDGGWRLGMAAVAAAGLGGLWMAWWSTEAPVTQPLGLGLLFAGLGILAGIVIGQAWRTDDRARHDRGWAAVAVLSHGIIVAGFGFQAFGWMGDPFAHDDGPVRLLALVPAALVVLAFRSWLRGRRRWLILVDLPIVAAGLLGSWLWGSLSGLSVDRGLEMSTVALGIAVVASVIAFATAWHRMPSPGTGVPPGEPDTVRITPEAPPTPDPGGGPGATRSTS